MSYCKGKMIEKQRGEAIKEVICEERSIAEVARRYGRARSTIYRWMQKWREINPQISFANYNHVSVPIGKVSHFSAGRVHWYVPTQSSAPHSHPNAISHELEQHILEVKKRSARCNQVVYYLLQREGIKVSFSTVRRTVERHRAKLPRRRGKRFYKINPKPIRPTHPGELVETDTVHLLNPLTGERKYIVTVVDVYSRAAFAQIFERISADNAATAVLTAQQRLGIDFNMVQSDNGAEFGLRFQTLLQAKHISTRHTRVRHPNDNGHIERFNRTLREECVGAYSAKPLQTVARNIERYLQYYNYDRIHLGLGCKIPMEVLRRS